MLILGGAKRDKFCDGIGRRDFIRVGALGIAGLALPELLWARQPQTGFSDARRGAGFGTAKSCILLHMTGGISHLDTFDLKPDAPDAIRGEFKPIATNVPGIQVSEHLPLLAGNADKYVIVRSVQHRTTDHLSSAYLMLTGDPNRRDRLPGDDIREFATDPPSIGAVVSKVRPGNAAMPPYVFMGHGYFPTPGRSAGYLGKTFNPFTVAADPNGPRFDIKEMTLPQDIPLNRLDDRRTLLNAVNRQTEQLLRGASPAAMQSHYRKALDMIGSERAQRAFNLAAEPPAVRDRYGRNTFGQACLLARRLVEHEVALVTVTWGNWDTHAKNFKLLKQDLLPTADRAMSALLEDLAGRGLLDETLVFWTSDFGRTPKINSSDAGRDHWPRCFSAVLAGGGIHGGQVYGASDRHAAYPHDNPVPAPSLVATVYHRLGISADTELPDQLGRPMRLCFGEPIRDLLD